MPNDVNVKYPDSADEARKVSMRDFRRDISKELTEIFHEYKRVVITRNNEERAYVVPVQIKWIVEELIAELGLNKFVAGYRRDNRASFNLLFEYIMKGFKNHEAYITDNDWDELKKVCIDHILLDTYPPEQHPLEIASAKEIYLTGTNLRRIVPRFKELRQIFQRGGSVHAMFVDPDTPAIEYATKQEMGAADPSMVAHQRREIDCNRRALLSLHEEVKLGTLKIYKIDFPLTYGMDVIDGESENGIIYVRYYPFSDDGKPIVKLTRTTERWYRHYMFQLERLRSAAKDW